MLKIKPVLYQNPDLEHLAAKLSDQQQFSIKGLSGSYLAVICSYLQEANKQTQLVVMPDGDSAAKLVDDLRAFMPEGQAVYFPADEVVPFDKGMFTPALYSMRMNALTTLVEREVTVAVTTPISLLRRVPSPETFRKNILRLKKGEEFERELLVEWLVESGYERMRIIEEIGQFSVRGGIIDVFSFESEMPYRLEFFDDEIESIREFDVLSQLSVGQLEEVRFLGQSDNAESTASIFDYFSQKNLIIWKEVEQGRQMMSEWWDNALSRFDSIKEELKLESMSSHYVALDDVHERLGSFRQIFHSPLAPEAKVDLDFKVTPPAAFQGNIKLLTEYLQRLIEQSKHEAIADLYVLHDGKRSKERLVDILEEEMGRMPPVKFIDGELHGGFTLAHRNIQIFTDHEIFNRLRMRRKKRKIRVSGSLIRNLQTLEHGDFVVHVDYGVGKYVGTERIKVAAMEKECIKLIYENNDVLYVTLDKLNRIQRYVSEEGFEPKLTKLGSAEWEKVKRKTGKAVETIAKELVELYARRSSQKGYSFPEDTLWQKELEASFPYEDTPDQAKAADAVKRDMETDRTMDRLICADVGYGKTEVAVRAAFKAVEDGKQVAVLVPTTILAQQHHITFRDRMANFPVRVEVISRFRSRKEQKQVLEDTAAGKVDILIGTHRLLSKDVEFSDLGLLVIDEEQRFGVGHKEKLRQMKINVDTVTLTATPIPRTLHMALMGARDLSVVDTAPGNRLPIKTEITNWDEELIYKAITYEMDRGGQIFFVHNRVQTIDAVGNMLRQIVPKARFAIAHGQMKERELEDIMNGFYKKEYDVLLATMIIENGVDIPNCNTIIINRADRFGLAQLYQLRGRVGRSDRQAYAYLIIPPQERLNNTAIKRLYAIEEFGDLGSGLKIAMRDLEIRGAGNLLGHKQSGFINAVGYDLYQKILKEAVESMQQATLPDEFFEDRMPEVDAAVDIDAEMYLPDDYINAPNEKVVIYHRLLNLSDMSLIDELVRELRDRFGPLPEPAQKLIEMVKIKKLASRLFIKHVKISRNKLILIFDERATAKDAFIDKQLPRYINQKMTDLKFSQTEKLKAIVQLKGNDQMERITFAKYFLRNI